MKLKTVIKLSVLWSLVFLGMCLVAKMAHSIPLDGDSGPMATRVFNSGGASQTPFAVTVGTQTPLDLYGVIDGSGTFSVPATSTISVSNYFFDPRVHKFTELTNPSTIYCMYYSTWSGFQDSDKYGVIPPGISTTTYVFSIHQKLFLRYQSGGSSQTVRGVVRY